MRVRLAFFASALILAAFPACSRSDLTDPTVAASSGGAGGQGSVTSTGTANSTNVSTSTSTSTSTAATTGVGGAPGFCGDGVVQPGEQCDDGNANPFDAC